MRYLILSIFILILSFLGVLKPIEEAGGFILSTTSLPFRNSASQIEDYGRFLVNIRSIYRENQILKEEVFELRSNEAIIDAVERENSALKDQFLGVSFEDFTKSRDEEMILVSITGNPDDQTNSTIYINGGKAKGVKLGSMVIYKNYLIGQVTYIEQYRSLVTLLYSPDLYVPVIRAPSLDGIESIGNESKLPLDITRSNISTEGIVSGDFGTSLKLDRVLQKEPLEKGDYLITSGREGNFRQGYIVGEVGEIYSEPTEPLKSAQVIPLLDIERLNNAFVFVERNEK